MLGKSISLRVTGKHPTSRRRRHVGAGGGRWRAGGTATGRRHRRCDPRPRRRPSTAPLIVGGFLTATTGTWSAPRPPTGTSGSARGAHRRARPRSMYRPTIADVARALTVQVVAGRPGYTEGSATRQRSPSPRWRPPRPRACRPSPSRRPSGPRSRSTCGSTESPARPARSRSRTARKKLKVLSLSASKDGQGGLQAPQAQAGQAQDQGRRTAAPAQIAGSKAKVVKLIVTKTLAPDAAWPAVDPAGRPSRDEVDPPGGQ